MIRGTTAEENLVLAGVLSGLVAALTYLAGKLLRMPPGIERAIFIYSGPLLVVAVVGISVFLQHPEPTASAILGSIFGIVAGVTRMLFSVVQEANVERFGRVTLATDAVSIQLWRDIKGSIFSVQGGLNYVFHFFGDATLYLFAIAMWRHPRFGRLFSIVTILLVTPHFVMKALTFPIPPAKAGLFDAGPVVMLAVLAMLVQMARSMAWVKTWKGERSPGETVMRAGGPHVCGK